MKRPLSTLALALIALTAAQTASAQFMPKRIWTLTVVVNVPGAVISVDNQQVPGNQTKVTGGAHNVKVTADGYLAFNGPVVVNGDQTFNVRLQPVAPPSTLSFVIPQPYHDPDMRGDDPRSEVRIFVDGRLANPRREMERIPVQPGHHRIRIASGVFSVELGDMEVRPGTSYVLELGMDVRVRAVKAGAY